LNAVKFLKRIQNFLKAENIDPVFRLITYKSFDNYTGSKGVFEKPIKYANERELRMYINAEKYTGTNIKKDAETLEFSIGGIQDISEKPCKANKESILRVRKLNYRPKGIKIF